jgi:NAD(P)-dependent dehydrogenase (short-subunit alcohol dehydrogenase family)
MESNNRAGLAVAQPRTYEERSAFATQCHRLLKPPLPLLVDGAAVILTASNVSIKGTPAFSVYSASKAAVRNFARSWTLDLKSRGIRVNVISPGPIKTPGLVALAGPDAAQQQGLLDYMASTVPLGRVGDPDDVAGAAVFLASSDASFIAGTEIPSSTADKLEWSRLFPTRLGDAPRSIAKDKCYE